MRCTKPCAIPRETRHDPCVIDVFIAAVRFMGGEPAKPWWKYTPERKQTLAAKAENG